jgi:quercetin dioxygenase-like cupin family protein
MAISAESGLVRTALGEGELILLDDTREIRILVSREELTITYARYPAGERIAGAHVHHGHTDAFYVLAGELTFEIGREVETITVSAGAFVAAPPGLAHSFRTDGARDAQWLTMHAHAGGFGAFMRGARDGVSVEWDIGAVPADGGRPARDAIVNDDIGNGWFEVGTQVCRLAGALPDQCVAEWRLPKQLAA